MVAFDTVAFTSYGLITLVLLPLPERARLATIDFRTAKAAPPQPRPTSRIWFWAVLAGAVGISAAMCLAFVTIRVTHVSQKSLNSPLDLAHLPVLTVFSVLLAIAATAGVVEEAAFRGYLISLIEERHGWLIAFLLSALLFFATHLSHAYASLNFLPFFSATALF